MVVPSCSAHALPFGGRTFSEFEGGLGGPGVRYRVISAACSGSTFSVGGEPGRHVISKPVLGVGYKCAVCGMALYLTPNVLMVHLIVGTGSYREDACW